MWRSSEATAMRSSSILHISLASWEMCRIEDESSAGIRGLSGIIKACFRRYAWAPFVREGEGDDWGERMLAGGDPGGGRDGVGVGPQVCDLVLIWVERPLLILLLVSELFMTA